MYEKEGIHWPPPFATWLQQEVGARLELVLAMTLLPLACGSLAAACARLGSPAAELGCGKRCFPLQMALQGLQRVRQWRGVVSFPLGLACETTLTSLAKQQQQQG